MAEDLSDLSKRFDRIESKIDKLSDAMVSLARTEEKLLALEADRANIIERLNRHSEKIDDINDMVKENTRVTANVVKITWIIVGTVVAGATKMLFFMN